MRRGPHALGFAVMRVARPDAMPDAPDRLRTWLDEGHHGSMDWMAAAPERRADPRALWREVRSIVVLGVNYAPAFDPLASLDLRDRATISVYARARDYHDVIKGKLKELAGFLAAQGGGRQGVRRHGAGDGEAARRGRRARLAGQAHACWSRASSATGSSSARSSRPRSCRPTTPEPDRCGSCRRCLDVCPTDAFPAPYRLDSRRCISYLTIEHKGHIAPELREGIGNRVFGCDDCLAVCPWNKFAEAGREARLVQREELAAPPLAELARLDDAAFRANFAGTPVKRTGRDRFVRNVAIALGNSGDPGLAGGGRPASRRRLAARARRWRCGRLDGCCRKRASTLLRQRTCRWKPTPTCAANGRARVPAAEPHNSPHAEVRAERASKHAPATLP